MAAAPGSPEQLRAAISALYGQLPAEQSQANAWLNAFSQTPAAWEACLQLLDPSERPEVCFFCANLLLTKARGGWHKLSKEQAASMGGMLSAKFQLFVGHAHAKLALQRLGLLLAAVASLSGAAACQAFAGQCVGMIATGGEGQGQPHVTECALSMLTALAEEVRNMDKARRSELVAATAAQWADIAALAQRFIPEQLAAGNFGLVHGALLCLQAWLRLTADASSTCRLSPGQLAASHPALLSCLFGLLGATATEAVTAERQEGLACELLCEVLGPGPCGPDPGQERAAVEAAMAALLALRDAALAPGPAGAGVARSVAGIASALAQRDTETVCGGAAAAGSGGGAAAAANGLASPPAMANGSAGGAAPCCSPHALPLAELMLRCVSRPERDVADAGVDYFLAVNTLPAAQRHPQMLAPLYASLLPPLLRGHACLPPGFTSWHEELEEDEEAFNRFRDLGLKELLETVYLMTGHVYLAQLQECVAAAPSWQQAEGALFCLKAVADPLRRAVASNGSAAAAAGGGAGQQAQQLLALFDALCGPAGGQAAHLSSPLVCATAASLVGAYAPWFDATPAAPLEGALRLLLHALRFADSWHAAAAAFRALTMRCAARLASAPVLQSLSAVAAGAVAPVPQPGQVAAAVPLPLEDRQAVVEGLVRVATCLNPGEALDAALSLQQPLLARTQAILAHGSDTAAGGGPAAKQLLGQLAEELRLMAALLRGMELPGPPQPGAVHPAMRLLEAAWPALSAVAEAPVCQRDQGVVQALCEVYKRAVQTARGGAKPLLPTLLKAVGDLFTATQQAACLDLLATVTEVFGEVKGAPDIAAAQQQALEGAVTAAGQVLCGRSAAGQPVSASGELLQSVLAVADAHLVFARELMLGSAVLPVVFEWAVVAAALREKEPANAAFSFLSHLLAAATRVFAAAGAEAAPGGGGGGGVEQQQAALLQQCIAQHGEALVRALVLGACDTAPRQLLRALAGVLYQLLHSGVAGEAGARWLLAVLQAPDLPGMAAGLLRPADCEALAKLALRQPPLPRGRFDALVMDFASLPRGEGTSDALLAYEL